MTAKSLKGEEREDNNDKKKRKRQDVEEGEEEEKEKVVVGEEERGGETVIVRAHRVSGWEQAGPRHRRTGSSSSSGGGDGRGGLSRSSSSSSSCSSSSSPSARVGRVSSKKREGSPSRRRGVAAAGDVEVKGSAAREKGGDPQRRERTGKSGGLLQERRAGKEATAVGEEGEDGRRRRRKESDQGSERERGGTRVDRQLQEKVASSSGKSEREGARDKKQRRRDRPSPRQEDDHKRSWGPEVGLDVVSASRLEPQGVTYDEMPRNYARGPKKQQTADDSGAGGGHASATEAEGNSAAATSTGERGGGGDYYGASGSGDGALGVGGRPGVVVVASQQGKPREEDKRGDADDRNKSGRTGGGGGERREGGGGVESADDDGVATPRHLPNGGGSGGVSPRAKGGPAECGESSPRGEGKSKTKRDGGAGGTGDDGAGKSDGRGGAGGGEKQKRKAVSGERAAPAARETPRKARASRTQNGASRRASELGPVTYVTHDRTTVVEEEDGQHDGRHGAGTGPAGRTGGGGGPSPLPSPFSRRAKRPRPTLQGGSARAVVWGQPCPACRGRSGEPPPGGIGKEADGTSWGGCSGPCRGAEGGAGTGQGPLRIGQYVYLRAPASEDLRRSLVSEGEFAAPKAGGLSGSELAGERIRVLRETGDGGNGSFAAADVVQFNTASGKHRLRFVQDGAVKDVELMKPPDLEADISDDADRGAPQDRPEEKGTGGGGGVRWLQRRARRRARDAIQRNAGGLCEGPSGEVRGLVGDEHDPFIQREENWRWALSRWRWNLGERDGYYSDARGGGGGRRGSGSSIRDGGKRGAGGGGSRDTERCGVPHAGDGMFPPIGRVVAVENRRVDTGKKVVEGRADGGGRRNGLKEEEEEEGKGRATEVWLKVARLWYPQDTRCGMDPFVHGKAEVFEACRVVRPDGHPDGECACAPDSRCGSAAVKGTETAAAHNGKRDSRLPGGARGGGSGSGGATRNRAGAVAASRLSGERPLPACLKIEPVTLWVPACEAHRVASVHPCIDGRLNPCAGKVVNDPYQPQAEFFISHRYCLEADAYFPLESPRSGANSSGGGGGDGGGGMETIVGALGVPGGAGGREGGLHKLPSPRSAKARLLNRTASDSMLDDLPPKWHPLKKRMSLGQQSPAGGGGGGTDSPVIGWESAIIRSGRADSGSSASGRTTPVDATPWSPRESGHDGRDAQKVYLCHRCRHTFPSSRLQRCSGRGCLNHFCAPCAVERSGGLSSSSSSSSSSSGGKGRARGMRWPTQPLPPPPLGGLADPGGGQHGGCETTPQAWTGPCCQGGCGCHECVTGAEEGLLSGWSARNGVASACAAATAPADVLQQRRGSRSLKKARVAAQAPGPAAAAAAAATPKKMVGWSGWQERPNGVQRNPDPSTGRASANTNVKGRGGGAPACVEGWAREAEGGGQDAVADTAVEWCRSCSGPGPAGSLARCYYCHGGVHVSGCHRFEEALTRRRLAEFGLGPAGHFSSAPSGEGAVGHGVAVCVDGRWRAGLVLCWSPPLGAHYVRYVDEWESGEGATSSLDAIPWEGEWVELPHERAREATVGPGGGECSSSSAKRFAATVRASGVRWPLVEISLRLFPPPPPPASGSSSSSSAPAAAKTPPESRSATKVLKALLKQNFLASQAAAAAKSGGAAVSHQYRPPGVAVISGTAPSARASGGGGGRGSSDGSDVGNGIEQAGEQRRKLWVCRACVEAKLHRLQRRVRSQFLVPWEDPDGPSAVVCAAAAATGRGGGGGGSTMASAPPVGAGAGSTESPMTPSKGRPPASVAAGGETPGAAGSPQPSRQEAAAGAGNDDGKDRPAFLHLAVAGSGNNRGPESKKRPREGSGLSSSAAAAAASSPEQSGPGGDRGREGGQRDKPAAAAAAAAATAAATAAKGEDGGNGNGNGGGRTTPARARGDDNRRLRWL
ncbi:unnamed protein product, partial [Ectocarpus sp. 8 AP-2014]